jgi:VWFA-related protein
MRVHRSLAAVFGISALGVALSAQQAPQPPAFSSSVKTVAVYATVTNVDGRLVPDLTADDFSIEDDGKRQVMSLFSNDVQPITVVMLLDRSGSMRPNFDLEEQAAEAFVAAMGPADKARIGSFSNRIEVDPEDFTSDHDKLRQIIRHGLQDEGPTPLWNAVNVGITDLLHQQGRRVVLVFTDGVDRPMNFSNNNSSLKSVMKRAEEEDVMVYAIGFAGQNGAPNGYGHGGSGRHGGGGHGGFGGRGGFGGGWGGGTGGRGGMGHGGGYGQRTMDDKPDEGLKKISDTTGGGYLEVLQTSDLVGAFEKVAEELHHQYALGFAPEKLDGKVHTLNVRIGKAGLRARTRKTYVATPTPS